MKNVMVCPSCGMLAEFSLLGKDWQYQCENGHRWDVQNDSLLDSMWTYCAFQCEKCSAYFHRKDMVQAYVEAEALGWCVQPSETDWQVICPECYKNENQTTSRIV